MTQEEMLKRPSGALVKTTLVDFPARVACTFFLSGCNLRCPYCYNIELANGIKPDTDTDFACANDVIEQLNKRKSVLTGFVLSGGEPMLNPLAPILIKQAKSLGYKIKIDTNGTLPEIL